MASLSTCHLGLWLGWQILLNLVNFLFPFLYIADILASFHSSGILDVFIDVSNIFCNGRQIFSDNSVSNLAPIYQARRFAYIKFF